MAKKNRVIEPQTKNVRYLTKHEIKSFNAMMEERRMAIGDDILDILEFDEIKQIEAVIFNGLVDVYLMGRKNHFRRHQIRLIVQKDLLCKLCNLK